jgi:hypothetical protein
MAKAEVTFSVRILPLFPFLGLGFAALRDIKHVTAAIQKARYLRGAHNFALITSLSRPFGADRNFAISIRSKTRKSASARRSPFVVSHARAVLSQCTSIHLHLITIFLIPSFGLTVVIGFDFLAVSDELFQRRIKR